MAFTFDDVRSAARIKSGAPDPASDSWREGLEILVQDHARADALSERGWGIIKNRYVEALSARMQVDEFMRTSPKVAAAPVKRPVFILGMPRTGTTMVSYLMNADPANRSMLRWEAYNIVPPAAAGELKSDPRCLAEVAKDAAMLKANPTVGATHWEPGDGPTECVHLLAQDFRSLMFAVLSVTPTYHDWILFCDMASAFEHRKRVLQILQQNNSGRWVLKMPSDSLFIRQLFRTFPDAKVIWTHRDPYAAFASSVSMRGRSRPIFNKDAGLDYMQARFPLQLALHLARPLELSRERPNDMFNLYYDDLLADPLAQMRTIYRWLGDEWTPAAQAGMQAWLDENPQGRYGAHQYSLQQWGFSKRDLIPYFSDYLKVHPVATAKEA
jgi:Sulfotransferase family